MSQQTQQRKAEVRNRLDHLIGDIDQMGPAFPSHAQFQEAYAHGGEPTVTRDRDRTIPIPQYILESVVKELSLARDACESAIFKLDPTYMLRPGTSQQDYEGRESWVQSRMSFQGGGPTPGFGWEQLPSVVKELTVAVRDAVELVGT